MTPAYRERYVRMLADVARSGFADEVAALWPLVGPLYREGGLLYVGRATDGWSPNRRCSEALADDVARWAQEAEHTSVERGWVPAEWTKSWFWRFAHRVLVDVLGQPDESWTKRLAWSNLFKVAPARAGNPSPLLANAQLPHTAELLGMEVEEVKPGLVVIAAGWRDWTRPVAHGSGWALTSFEGRFVEQVGTIAGRPAIVTRHPQGIRMPDAEKVAEVRSALALATGHP